MHVLCQSNYQVKIQTWVTEWRTAKLLKLAKFTSWQKDRSVLADGVLERCNIGMKIASIKDHLRLCMEKYSVKRELNCLFLEC